MTNPSKELLRGVIISKVSDCKGLTKEQLDAAIDGGFLDRWLNHSNKDLANKYRETILTGAFCDFDESGNQVKMEEKKVEPTNPQPVDNAGQEPKPVEPIAPQATPPKEEAKKWGDYDSPDKLFEALKAKEESEKQLREMYSKSRLSIDKHNADAGLLSEQLRQEREERERVTAELNESRKRLSEFDATAKKTKDLVLPDIPQDVSELTDSNSVFWNKFKAFTKGLSENHELTQRELASAQREKQALLDQVKSLTEGFKDIKEERKRRASDEVKDRYQKALNNLYSDIADCQAKNSELATSVPFKTINEGVLQGGEDYLKTLPQTDVEKFKQITSLVNNGYGSFIPEIDGDGNSLPIFQRNTAFESFNDKYFLHLNKSGELARRTQEREKATTEQTINRMSAPASRGTAVTIPSGFAGGGSTEVANLSAEEEAKELKRLLDLQDAKKLTPTDEFRLDSILYKQGLFGAIPKKNLERIMAKQ